MVMTSATASTAARSRCLFAVSSAPRRCSGYGVVDSRAASPLGENERGSIVALAPLGCWLREGNVMTGLVFAFCWLASALTPIRHQHVVISQARPFGWPANNGIWIWGDEIVVGFPGLLKTTNAATPSTAIRELRALCAAATEAGPGRSKLHRFSVRMAKNAKARVPASRFHRSRFCRRATQSRAAAGSRALLFKDRAIPGRVHTNCTYDRRNRRANGYLVDGKHGITAFSPRPEDGREGRVLYPPKRRRQTGLGLLHHPTGRVLDVPSSVPLSPTVFSQRPREGGTLVDALDYDDSRPTGHS
jgi:hypothetical protein